MNSKKEVYRSLQLLMQSQRTFARGRHDGYALLMASVMSILIFSILSAYLFSSRLHKSTANAIVDGGSTFYASETALNKRANQVRQNFSDYVEPDGESLFDTDIATRMSNCINPSAPAASKGSGDYACTTEIVRSKEAVLGSKSTNNGGVSNDVKDVTYTSYTFMKPTQRPGGAPVELKVMDSGDYKGLMALDYRYRVYSTAVKQSSDAADKNVSAQSMLQMEFINRLIPVFQFAAFYEKDLEMTNSGLMNITGPVHTNSSLYLAPGGLLILNNRSTYTNSAYRSLPYTANHGVTADGQRVMMAGGGPYSVNKLTSTTGYPVLDALNVVPAWTNPNLLISDADIIASKGMLKKISKLKLPEVGFLKQNGDFFDKADVRILFNPNGPATTATIATATSPAIPATPVPFNVISINRDAATSVDFSSRPGLINSLQQPVLFRLDSFTADRQLSAATRLCPRLDGGLGEPTSFAEAISPVSVTILPLLPTALSRQRVITALQETIAKSTTTITYNNTKGTPASISAAFRTAFINTMRTSVPASGLPALSNSTATLVASQPLNIIAALSVNTNSVDAATSGNGGCFLPAPMQVVNGFDRKENFTSTTGRAMTILQSNIKSLTAWNRDGWHWDTTALSMNSTADLLFLRRVATAVPTGLTNIKATGSCDLECLGLATNDTTEGGGVWHYSLVNRTTVPYNYPSGDGITRSNTAGTSSFGFAFSGGNRLPGPLTIASDQAIYLQGDYNSPSNIAGDVPTANGAGVTPPDPLDESRFPDLNPDTATNIPPAREKRPASFLGDSMTILSNRCYDANYTVAACLTASNTALQVAGTATARVTVVRAAILSGTESTVLAGGALSERGAALNNHIRMLENWYTPVTAGLPHKTFKYRGSFVSKGLQTEFNGQYRGGGGNGFGNDYYGIPNRDFGFDRDFNRVDGLPPLTPRVTYLTQQVFKRDYDSGNR